MSDIKTQIVHWFVRMWHLLVVWWQRQTRIYQERQEKIKAESEMAHERLTMPRALSIFLDTFGLGSRSIFRTAGHLLWRPGYMISDYINGRRGKYLQPFMTFFLLTLIIVNLGWALHIRMPKHKDMTIAAYELMRDHSNWFTPDRKSTVLRIASALDVVHDWRDANRNYDILLRSIWVMLITWLLWRNSPRVGNGEWLMTNGEWIEGYNLAEIVTAIVYILCQVQLLTIAGMLIFRTMPFEQEGWQMIVPKLVLFGVLLVDFKQLFQRDWWTTVWRTFIIMLFT